MVSAGGAGFWSGKRVLLTGHTGFKGAWLALWLQRRGAKLTGLALDPEGDALYLRARIEEGLHSRIADIRDADAVGEVVAEARPEIVFHFAAQALVRAGYADPLRTYDTNVRGTVHLLDALRHCSDVRVVVVVTTDKVYLTVHPPRPFNEDDALGGYDPYSASKAAAELVVASYRDAFLAARDVAVSTARAGNVIGGGDWAADRLIPDAVRAWSSDHLISIRRPAAVRPWQHVLEPLSGYMRLAECTWHQPELAGAYNIGPAADSAASVSEVVELARAAFGRGHWRADGRDPGPHETAHLTLDASRARTLLGVQPRWTLPQAVTRTMHWYRQVLHEGADARAVCLADIAAYEAAE
jgi:CDP-glucose 4,6-dehydratase